MAQVAARPGIGFVRIAAVVLSGVVLMWLSIAVTLAMTTAASQPRQVLSLWPSAAGAKAVIAWTLVTQSPTKAQRDEAAALAGTALEREPVFATAASAFGSAVGLRGEERRAVAAFTYAERLSRRELKTQLWLIERSVQKGDIDGALRHYDIALRTTPSASALLLPVLAHASDDTAVRRPLIARLRRKPSWRLGYLQAMLEAKIDPVAVADQLAGAALDPADAGEAHILSDGLAQIAGAGRYRLAEAALPGGGNAPAIRNAGFERAPSLLPFDWWLNTDGDLLAYRDPASNGEGSYILRIAASRGGMVARQLVTLPGGRFVLSGIVGDTGEAGGVPSIVIACAGRHDAIAAAPLAAPAGGTQRFGIGFAVPEQGCEAQWITVTTPTSGAVSAWIDALRLQPATAAHG